MTSRSRRRAPGILAVAERAGVSPATVSRCFNHRDRVRPDTRARVEQAARDLGYIRDRTAGALHSRVSGSVGLVVPTVDNAIFAELVDAFAERLRAHERTLLLATHGYDLGEEVALVRSLLERRIDGVALVGLEHDPAVARMLALREVPVVSIWNHRPGSEIPCIGADNRRAGALAAGRLLALGHRDIALLFPDDAGNDRAADRRRGAIDTLAAAGAEPVGRRLLQCPYDLSAAKACARSLLGADPPSAVLCGNDIIAHGVLFAARALGVEVPARLSVVGIGDFRGSADIEPALSTVRLPAQRIGREGADALVGALQASAGGVFGAVVGRAVPVQWVERGSVAAPARC